MFTKLESLLYDLDQLAETQQFPATGVAVSSSEIGQSVIMLALGRAPTALIGLGPEENVSERRQQTARQLVARWFLARDGTLYSALGVAPDCSHEILRENYRRLMGLVHPDTRPVGFPEDSASRVNMAYSVLADADRRASYDASMLLLAEQTQPAATRHASAAARTAPDADDGVVDRFRAAVPKMRFGNGLLIIAGLMLLPIGYALFSLNSRDVQPQIVEARPKLILSPDVAGIPSASTNQDNAAPGAKPNAGIASNAAPAAISATAPIAERASPAASTEKSVASMPVSAAPLTLSSRLQGLLGDDVPTAPPLVETAARVKNSTPSLAPVRSSADPVASAPSEVTATAAPRTAPTSAVTVSTTAGAADRVAAKATPVSDATSVAATAERPVRTLAPVQQAAAQQAAAIAAASDNRINVADAEEILMKLSGAYESGSISAFSKVFASSMAGRRQLLSDYERVFLQTRQRSIRFTQFKHKISGDKLLTSGFAVVSTVDNDNRASSQRVFLEIDIGRESDGLRIERLHNYPLN